MARAPVAPTSVGATAPEAFAVLQQRLRAAEDETGALVRDLQALGADGRSLQPVPVRAADAPGGRAAISPVRARAAFAGESDVLWKRCEALVNRMCRLESVVQTLKLNVFRLQTEKELNPQHAAHLEQRLSAVQEEHLQELKAIQLELLMSRQRLSKAQEAEEKAKKDVQRLSSALEMATATKTDAAIAVEQLRTTKQKMNLRLQELKEQLSKEASQRQSLEKSQVTMLRHVQDMERTVEAERKQVQLLQQDCHGLHQEVQLAREKLQEEKERTIQLEQECTQLKAELESKNCIISHLTEEAKSAQVSFSREHKENMQLHSEITVLRETAEKVQTLNDQLNQQCSELSATLRSVSMENVKLVSDHQAMLKIEKTANEVIQGRNQLEIELTENKLEMGAMRSTLQTLEEENMRLMGHLAALEHQQHAQQQVEQILAELTDSKNKLAYDKGKLQTKVQELEKELQSLADAHLENSQLRKLNTALETKYTQAQTVFEHKEDDFALAVKSRDEALRECQKIKGQMEAMEERERHKVANLQHQLKEAKEDNDKVTSILENVLVSHSKMQEALEKVQTELGRKDSEITSLRKDRTQSQQKIQSLEAELEQCQAKLVFIETQHNNQVGPLRKALEVARVDNKKLALSLEQTLQTNSTLQSKLTQTQGELDCKEIERQKLIICRQQLIEEAKTGEKLYSERLESLRKQFQTEREATKKAVHRESIELKKALDEASSKSAVVSRTNKELRQKVTELEKSLDNYREKLKSQKAQIRHLLASKANNAQNTERIKEIESELRQMEVIKQQYQKKNYEQSQSIQKFMTELTGLQSEMQMLANNQYEVETQNRQLETHLELERKLRQQLEDQCQSLEETVKHLKKCKEETEQKLKEASVESEQITANLEEAHRWFKFKFDRLQLEPVKNHQLKIPNENSYGKEAEKEEAMKLPSQASLNRWETKQQLKLIARKYQFELNRK
ncbi:coiled-coil domain-containing protein 150 isoform X5 [Alligator mississippiensis]|uniref:coiled-coil domain-containing protein 150 isoform X5 n=1 Tax=Alligator mississippiensis TaxID=8496 RepID=UPI000907512D|nr:coiled-coil domain-containing protein 150 isoform X5 [Alligator mississippiensis]